jgi:5'-phosphate synthase pdxT subunit
VRTPTIGVLAMQGDVREHAAALAACGARTCLVRRPSELAAVDGLVLPGGESTTIDKLLRRFELMERLRARIGAGLPVYGSCAGMILLADRITGGTHDQQTIGGLDVLVRRNAFGRQVDSFEERLDAPVLGAGPDDPPMTAVFIRAPWVEEVGPEVEVLATVSTGPKAGRIAAVRQGALMATAFHPEISSDHRVHEAFVAMVRRAGAARSHG